MNFNTGKDQLLARYRLGTEQALEQADVLNAPNTTLLQALAIYLAVLQYTGEARFAWSLTGVLVRLAASMKIQRDGSNLTNVSPFEAEMRRRHVVANMLDRFAIRRSAGFCVQDRGRDVR